MNRLVKVLAVSVVAAGAALALAIGLGGPATPPVMAGVNDPFKAVDYSGLPPLRHARARDGVNLAYRQYAPATSAAKGSVVLLHGSSADSRSMHVLATALAAAGFETYALDVRGHGDSGEKGDIAYIGQLEHDLEDLMQALQPAAPSTLLGLSAGGGFALRVAGSANQELFDHYVLLTPFLSQDAPTYRAGSGGWVSVGLPRYIALSVLDGFGMRAFNHLPVVRYALSEEAGQMLTPQYSFNLAQNYRPHRDYLADIRSTRQAMEVIVGSEDEMFHADRFAGVFEQAGRAVPVTIVDQVNHIGVSLDAAAVQQSVDSIERLHASHDISLR